MPRHNHGNLEIHKIPRQNQENQENLIVPLQKTKIIKFLEFHAIITKNHETLIIAYGNHETR